MKKIVFFLFLGFVGLNGIKQDPILQSNLNELKTSLSTLKFKLGSLNNKLETLKKKFNERIIYGQTNRSSFFKDFMGFEEVDFNAQKINDQLIFEEHNKSDGKPNFKIKDATGNIYQCGFLEQISLGELRTLSKAKAKSLKPEDQKTIIFNVIEASGFNCSGPVDIGKLQGDPENKNAVFQVASNFNALETTSHNDNGNVNTVKNYWGDNTQGPRASISALPGLIYRRYYYFYPDRKDLACNLWGQRGQTNNNNIDDQGRKFQINFLEDLPINTMNGYIWGNDGFIEGKFGPIPDKKHTNPSNIDNIKEENASKFKIGYHSGIQVAFGATYGGKSGTQEFFYDPSQIIDQVFAAALVTQNAFQQPSDKLNEATDKRAKLILDWTYEAMLKSAFLKGKRDGNGKIKVFLTRIGGGAFANNQEWIDEAIIKAVKDPVLENSGLEVTLNNFVLNDQESMKRMKALVKEKNGTYMLYNTDGKTITETDIAK